MVKGYAKELENGWLASSTTTLIRCGGKLIISDPGCNRKRLLESLKNEGLKTGDIDFIFLTHGHIDHALLAGIFENAKSVTFEHLMYEKDLQVDFKDDVFGPGTKVIETPGHSPEHISLLIDTAKGKCAIAGDVFWWTGEEKQTIDVNKKDDAHPAELNVEKLTASRKKLLEMADYIIPGHGEVFRTGRGGI